MTLACYVNCYSPEESYDCDVSQTQTQTQGRNESHRRICKRRRELNHRFSASTTSPLGMTLTTGATALYALIAHFENEGEHIREFAKHRPPMFVFPRFSLCNLHAKGVPLTAVNRTLFQLGFGVLETSCVTEIDSNPFHTLLPSIRALIYDLSSVGLKAARAAGREWSKSYQYQSYKYHDSFDECELFRVSAVRVRGRWAIHAGITNHKPSDYKEHGRREKLTEFLRLDGAGGIESIHMILQEKTRTTNRTRTDVERIRWIRNSTTLLEFGGGTQGTSLFDVNAIPANNPAIRAALSIRSHQRQQAHAYTRYSQICKLMFPVTISLIPISIFTDISPKYTFLFHVFKDLLNSLPLAIKGIELIWFGRGTRPEATRTWFYGGVAEEDLALAETWHAFCNANYGVVYLGYIFIIFSIFMTILGVCLEMMCMEYFKRRRVAKARMRREKTKQQQRQVWTEVEEKCANCGCIKEPVIEDETLLYETHSVGDPDVFTLDILDPYF